MRRLAALTGAMLACGLAVQGSAVAAPITVANHNDSGPGSLRAALAAAGDGDTVILPAGVYPVTSGELLADSGLHLKGAGARRTIIRSDGSDRVIHVGAGVAPITFSGVTVEGGSLTTGDGGGIFSERGLRLSKVVIRNNRANPGNPFRDGGGVFVSTSADSVIVRDSLFEGNVGYNGGGMNAENVDSLTVRNTTFTRNTAGQVTNNDGNGYGGGLYGSAAAITLNNVTIAANRAFSAGESGAGLVFSTGPGGLIRNTIIAGNQAFADNGLAPGSPGNPAVNQQCDMSGVPADEDHNIEGATDCNFTGPTSRQSTGARLHRAADNGGPTRTMALRPGSPAINRGAACETTDQRGAPRTLGGACDIGAYELIRCRGVAANRIGTARRDKLVGTSRRDGILALGGNDVLLGRGGNDVLCGGRGRDRLIGGRGRDRLFGGPGRDLLIGGPGRDLLRGGPGRDRQRQ